MRKLANSQRGQDIPAKPSAVRATKDRIPAWAEQALQGITFWIGHRRALYRHYPLLEGAINAELCNLINSNLGDGEYLHCEVKYRNIVASRKLDSQFNDERVDLLIASTPVSEQKRNSFNFDASAQIAIEVKRGKAQASEIDKDLNRLALLKEAKPELSTFLVIVSEKHLPSKYVGQVALSGSGMSKIRARAKEVPIGGTTCRYKVRRLCKAAASFKSARTTHYAVLIEVFSTQVKPTAKSEAKRAVKMTK
jgi:hypothetical protein